MTLQVVGNGDACDLGDSCVPLEGWKFVVSPHIDQVITGIWILICAHTTIFAVTVLHDQEHFAFREPRQRGGPPLCQNCMRDWFVQLEPSYISYGDCP